MLFMFAYSFVLFIIDTPRVGGYECTESVRVDISLSSSRLASIGSEQPLVLLKDITMHVWLFLACICIYMRKSLGGICSQALRFCDLIVYSC